MNQDGLGNFFEDRRQFTHLLGVHRLKGRERDAAMNNALRGSGHYFFLIPLPIRVCAPQIDDAANLVAANAPDEFV